MSSITSVPDMGATEMKRAVLRCGGLWSCAELGKICGVPSARDWQYLPGCPEPAWQATAACEGHRRKLYCGYELHAWLEETGRHVDAALLYEAIVQLRRRG